MNYNFDKLTKRRNSNCYKWDMYANDDILPMWVADMDFEVAPCITKALHQRVDHAIFGYTYIPDSYYQSIINWFKRRHNWAINSEWILYTTGVIPAMSVTIKALCQPGDKVLVQTPVYNHFFSSIINNGCQVVESALVRKDNTYCIDFEDFDKKTTDPKVKVFLLCNPHNPASRLWTANELLQMEQICRKNNTTIISDEIHCEIVMPDQHFTPFGTISNNCLDNAVVLNSPSKSFNTAGLQIANIICKDAKMRANINRTININEVCDVNPFGVIALQAAYNEGEQWLDEMCNYVWNNYLTLVDFCKNKLPQIRITKLEGTYLVWADISATGKTSDQITQLLIDKGHVMVSSGTIFGKTDGEGFIRINIACPRSRLIDGLNRIANVLGK
ncbi:MAG: pyridoxal phosphate-dependent aminotransferase [Salinivirgaceae bacterium]|nr:pyridoxal phosphate-dependent aminotransferase [Salinivirgaceae bacterium]